MKKERVEFTIKLSVDLDPVPGWGYEAEDFVALAKQNLTKQIPHYNPVVEIVEAPKVFEVDVML